MTNCENCIQNHKLWMSSDYRLTLSIESLYTNTTHLIKGGNLEGSSVRHSNKSTLLLASVELKVRH